MKSLVLAVMSILISSSVIAASTETLNEAKSKIVELRITWKEVKGSEAKKNIRARIENLKSRSICSGAFVSPTGDILTARHCADNAELIEVTTPDGREYIATPRAISKTHDLALLHVDKFNTPYFKLATSLSQGQRIYTLGSPIGITGALSTGIVAKLGGDINFIDCSALPGNSGGPAFDDNGELVGVVSAGFIVMLGTTHLNIMQSLESIVGFALSLGR